MLNRKEIIQEHFNDLVAQYKRLSLIERNDSWIVQGVLEFSASYGGVSIKDRFDTELLITDMYPDVPPIAKETGGRISSDFHTNPNGLCLGAPLEVRKKFRETPSLLGFVNNQVIPFFFSFCYFQEYGEMPFGELSHGTKGILEYYAQLFNVTSNIAVVHLLKVLTDRKYRGHQACPCGAKKRLRDCHGRLLQEISSYQGTDDFFYEYIQCLTHLYKEGHTLPKSLLNDGYMDRLSKFCVVEPYNVANDSLWYIGTMRQYMVPIFFLNNLL